MELLLIYGDKWHLKQSAEKISSTGKTYQQYVNINVYLKLRHQLTYSSHCSKNKYVLDPTRACFVAQ